jgi:hypothetical protein
MTETWSAVFVDDVSWWFLLIVVHPKNEKARTGITGAFSAPLIPILAFA